MTKQARRLVEDAYQQACTQALALVEQEARAILRRKPRLREFVMAMGTWFFTDQHGELVEHMQPDHYDADWRRVLGEPYVWVRKLVEFFDEWDESLKLTGIPMRFTAEGPVVTEW